MSDTSALHLAADLGRRVAVKGVREVVFGPVNGGDLRRRLTSAVGLLPLLGLWLGRCAGEPNSRAVRLALRLVGEGLNDPESLAIPAMSPPTRTAAALRGGVSSTQLVAAAGSDTAGNPCAATGSLADCGRRGANRRLRKRSGVRRLFETDAGGDAEGGSDGSWVGRSCGSGAARWRTRGFGCRGWGGRWVNRAVAGFPTCAGRKVIGIMSARIACLH
jgi:hypothetical protein